MQPFPVLSSRSGLFHTGPAILTLILLGAFVLPAQAQTHEVQSPDGTVSATVETGSDRLTYAVSYEGQTLVEPSPLSMTLAGRTVLGADPSVENTSRRQVDETLEPVVPEKFAEVPNQFRELRIDFAKDFSLVVRAYNSGAAYRFETNRGDSITVETEQATFDLADGEATGLPTLYWARNENSFITHSESYYQPPTPLDSIAGQMSTLPLLATYDNGPRVAITEANLRDYAGMFVEGSYAAPSW